MVSFSNTTKFSFSSARKNRWTALTRELLGDEYDLSVVLVGDTRMRSLNKRYRDKDTPTNVLSFPLSETSGEIYIDTAYAEREAPDFAPEHDPHVHLDYLFIHGILHLAGHDHGDMMEKTERRLLKQFFAVAG